jgi:hypothetical protein
MPVLMLMQVLQVVSSSPSSPTLWPDTLRTGTLLTLRYYSYLTVNCIIYVDLCVRLAARISGLDAVRYLCVVVVALRAATLDFKGGEFRLVQFVVLVLPFSAVSRLPTWSSPTDTCYIWDGTLEIVGRHIQRHHMGKLSQPCVGEASRQFMVRDTSNVVRLGHCPIHVLIFP